MGAGGGLDRRRRGGEGDVALGFDDAPGAILLHDVELDLAAVRQPPLDVEIAPALAGFGFGLGGHEARPRGAGGGEHRRRHLSERHRRLAEVCTRFDGGGALAFPAALSPAGAPPQAARPPSMRIVIVLRILLLLVGGIAYDTGFLIYLRNARVQRLRRQGRAG